MKHKKQLTHRSSKPGKVAEKSSSAVAEFFKRNKWVLLVAVLAGAPFVFGKYMELSVPAPFDSGAYAYSAKRVLDGAVPGVDESVTARVGTLLANMAGVALFGYSDMGPKVVQMVMQLAALVFMFAAVRKVFGTLAAGVAVVVASFYLSAPHIAKYGNVKEQFMIASMVIAVSALVLRYAGGRWWWLLVGGAFLAMGPMFKETALSAIAATGVFMGWQLVRGWRPRKAAAVDIGLLVLGGLIAILPVHAWLAVKGASPRYEPWYNYVSQYSAKAFGVLQSAGSSGESQEEAAAAVEGGGGGYISAAREMRGWSEQAPVVLRFYWSLIVPVGLALASIVVRLFVVFARLVRKRPRDDIAIAERLVLLLAVWWLLDMAFVWISPRSFEEYYLPLCASGAMLGAYFVWVYRDRIRHPIFGAQWTVGGVIILIALIVGAWPIFFGLRKSPFHGQAYSSPIRGYMQRLEETREKGAWQLVAEYVKAHSRPGDTMYVWGWYPGIYVEAGLVAPYRRAFESEMHVMRPDALRRRVEDILSAFEESPPRFIVDARKSEFPWDRPPLVLWPSITDLHLYRPQGPQMDFLNRLNGWWQQVLQSGHAPARLGALPDEEHIVEQFEIAWSQWLEIVAGSEEVERFEAMKPLRDYVMANYDIVPEFGPRRPHILFRRKAGR